MWWKKNKRKVIAAAAVAAVLAAAFYFGGNAPGLRGWKAGDSSLSQTQSAAPSQTDVSPSPSPLVQPGETSGASPSPSAQTQTAAPAASAKAGSEISARPGGAEGGLTAAEKEAAAQKLAGSGSSAETGKGDKAYSEQEGMQLSGKTGKDKYQTDPVPAGKPVPVEPQDAAISDKACTCTLSISCATILDNMGWLDPDKKELVPSDGWILKPTQVTFYEGESVFNVLLRTCKQNKIHMEYKDTPIYNSAYIEGIHNLYEFDCGDLSGWMYKVNDWFPNYGCSRYQLRDGDVIAWVYTCNLGYDVGGGYSAAG